MSVTPASKNPFQFTVRLDDAVSFTLKRNTGAMDIFVSVNKSRGAEMNFSIDKSGDTIFFDTLSLVAHVGIERALGIEDYCRRYLHLNEASGMFASDAQREGFVALSDIEKETVISLMRSGHTADEALAWLKQRKDSDRYFPGLKDRKTHLSKVRTSVQRLTPQKRLEMAKNVLAYLRLGPEKQDASALEMATGPNIFKYLTAGHIVLRDIHRLMRDALETDARIVVSRIFRANERGGKYPDCGNSDLLCLLGYTIPTKSKARLSELAKELNRMGFIDDGLLKAAALEGMHVDLEEAIEKFKEGKISSTNLSYALRWAKTVGVLKPSGPLTQEIIDDLHVLERSDLES